MLCDVWICFSVQRDISGAEDLTLTSEYGGMYNKHAHFKYFGIYMDLINGECKKESRQDGEGEHG